MPQWRSTAYASLRPTAQRVRTVEARYSGQQHANLANSDAFAYFDASKYATVDLRARWQFGARWLATFGIDNANNKQF